MEKTYKMSDYKGKHFVLQDTIDPDSPFDFEIGEIKESEITDAWLREHVEASIYYGIPAAITKDELLNKRIEKLYQEYAKNGKLL